MIYQYLSEITKNIRYERKYIAEDISLKELEAIIILNGLKEIYHIRQINNIYFDSDGFMIYRENIDGIGNRLKVRIRWYNENSGLIKTPNLEFKIRENQVGKKVTYKLNGFLFNKTLSFEIIAGLFQKSTEIPDLLKNYLKCLYPVLINSYTRRYFTTQDKHIRLTLDYNIEYYAQYSNLNLRIKREPYAFHPAIMELKYDKKYDNYALQLTRIFPLRLSKNSKFVNGLQYFY